jgi:hypothetical protein
MSFVTAIPLRRTLGILIAAAISTGAAAPAFSMTCIKSRDIRSHKLVDDQTLDFQMKNGVVYRNQTKSSCSGLRFFGYIHRSPDGSLCDYEVLRILDHGGVCALGTFTKLPPKTTSN